MTQAPKSSSLLSRVQQRLTVASVARATYVSSLVALGLAVVTVLAIRLLGLIPQNQEQATWLLAVPAIACLGAGLFYRRVEMQQAARAVDEHAKTKDLFLTLSSLHTSAGEYQPLVSASAEEKAESVVPTEVVPFRFWERLGRVAFVASLLALAVWLTPQLDPFGKVEAAAKAEERTKEIGAILKDTEVRKAALKKERQIAENESDEIENQLADLKSDFRKMMPKKTESNAQVLSSHSSELGDMWKSVSNDQLRRMMNQPISDQQLGTSTRSEKMNQMLKELQDGKTETLKQELQKARETMEKLAKAETKEEKEKLQKQLQKELQDLKKFSKDKAGSKQLTDALNKAMKSLEVCKECQNPNGEKGEQGEKAQQLQKEAMEALKESLDLSEQEMEKVAQAAKDLKKLEEALETLSKAKELNQKGELDGSKCEDCETMQDYADLYAQMNGEAGEGEGNKGNDRGFGKGGEAQYDESDPEGYKDEKEKTQVQQGKVLLAIKTKEYADELDFDPDKMREYQQSVGKLKSSVQSALDSEEIPPGYVDGIKGYFDNIEKVDPKLQK
ncbi:MAG: hypothetical protein NXI04_00225 [Planctomycetaceae bacterium]|nr:hypothetical protein [Planctomycetaceae bacterium]